MAERKPGLAGVRTSKTADRFAEELRELEKTSRKVEVRGALDERLAEMEEHEHLAQVRKKGKEGLKDLGDLRAIPQEKLSDVLEHLQDEVKGPTTLSSVKPDEGIKLVDLLEGATVIDGTVYVQPDKLKKILEHVGEGEMKKTKVVLSGEGPEGEPGADTSVKFGGDEKRRIALSGEGPEGEPDRGSTAGGRGKVTKTSGGPAMPRLAEAAAPGTGGPTPIPPGGGGPPHVPPGTAPPISAGAISPSTTSAAPGEAVTPLTHYEMLDKKSQMAADWWYDDVLVRASILLSGRYFSFTRKAGWAKKKKKKASHVEKLFGFK